MEKERRKPKAEGQVLKMAMKSSAKKHLKSLKTHLAMLIQAVWSCLWTVDMEGLKR